MHELWQPLRYISDDGERWPIWGYYGFSSTSFRPYNDALAKIMSTFLEVVIQTNCRKLEIASDETLLECHEITTGTKHAGLLRGINKTITVLNLRITTRPLPSFRHGATNGHRGVHGLLFRKALKCMKLLEELTLHNDVYAGGYTSYDDDEVIREPNYAETEGWLDDILEGQKFQTLWKLEISGFHIEIESMLTFIHKHASSLQSVTFKKCSIHSETFRTQLVDVLSQYTNITSCVTGICIWQE